MSQENVELVRQGYEAFNRGGEGWLAFLDPDVELDERYLAPDAVVYRGLDGVRGWLQVTDGAASRSFDVLRWFARGDVVVTEVVARVRGVASGAEGSVRLAHGYRIRNEKAVYVASFRTVDEALAALGLSERDAQTVGLQE